MNDAITQFRDAIRAAGLNPPMDITSGKFHRFPGADKNDGNTAGWCLIFDNHQGGCFGDWSTGLSENWQIKREQPFSPDEQVEFNKKVSEAKKAQETERQAKYTEAAKTALNIWNESSELFADQHQYALQKRIMTYGARLNKENLIIPIYWKEAISSLQFISSNGSKYFLSNGKISGAYYTIGVIDSEKPICIAEGFATAASIYEATSYAVIVAFNANNLKPVALEIREKFPQALIIICADDDIKTKGNPGMSSAKLAASISNAKIAIPTFGEDRACNASDFNDMAILSGLEAVKRVIDTAQFIKNNHDWLEPVSLLAKIEPKPYPIEALPDSVREYGICQRN